MLSVTQEKLIRSLHSKKGRQSSGLCLVEGSKVISLAGDLVQYEFGSDDSKNYKKLVTTQTPQESAAVAQIPTWGIEQIESKPIVVVADGIQDPGNIGAILRLCLGFVASLILVESVDPTSPKVIRSSAGTMFQVPWLQIERENMAKFIKELDRPVYRLEKKKGAADLSKVNITLPVTLIAGSEGKGIKLSIKGKSVYIKHSKDLESLNVGHALAIALHELSQKEIA